MLSNAIVVTLLMVAVCILLGSCLALLVLVVEFAREAAAMMTERYGPAAHGGHQHSRRGLA